MKTTTKTLITKTLIIGAAMAASLTAMTAPSMASAMEPTARMKPAAVAFRNPGVDLRASAQLNTRIDTLQGRLNISRRTHELNGRDFARLNAKLDTIVTLKRMDERSGGGLDRGEVATLNTKLDMLSSQIAVNRRG